MKFAGIIAEYDPFHNGHAWQLAQAKALGAEHVAVAMSCGLTQRGSLPLLPEAVRVQAALQCGADLIFALPAPCACAGAEAFARAGVRILAAAGCDALVFGAETPDAALLMEAAREKEVIVERAVITVGAAQNLFLGEGTRQDYGMIRFDAEPFDVEESYMRLMMES